MKALLLETIRCEQGKLQNLEWHQERAARSCRELFGTAKGIGLQHIEVPREVGQGLFKCRVLYDTIIRTVEFTPYTIRPVKKLMLIRADQLEYPHKLAGRTEIQKLFNQRGPADDILMVKNGHITDTSYANIALFDGSMWHTPSNPLLKGTRRASLVAAGVLSTAVIPTHALGDFQEVRLINAMMSLEEGPRLHPRDILQIT